MLRDAPRCVMTQIKKSWENADCVVGCELTRGPWGDDVNQRSDQYLVGAFTVGAAMMTCFSEADVADHGRGVRVHPPFTFAQPRAGGRGWGQAPLLISTFVGVST